MPAIGLTNKTNYNNYNNNTKEKSQFHLRPNVFLIELSLFMIIIFMQMLRKKESFMNNYEQEVLFILLYVHLFVCSCTLFI